MRITALGTARGLETRLVPERGYDLRLITPVPLPPRKPSGDLLRLPWRVRNAIRETRAIFDETAADVVIASAGTWHCRRIWPHGPDCADTGFRW